jgi:hypothetical protein
MTMKTQPGKTLKRTVRFLPALVFAAVLLFSGVTAWHYTGHILDSDAASELVLGKLLADENAIVAKDWLYGNEIRFFNSNLLYMPLFKIFGDWRTLRFVSILLFQLLLAGSYFYLGRRMKLSLNAYFLSASLLLLPLNVVYGRLGLYHNYYSTCFIYGFLIAGLYLSLIGHRGQKRLRQILRLITVLALSVMSCMNGFRQLPGTMIPLFATALAVAVKERRNAPDAPAKTLGRGWFNVDLAGAILAAGFAGLLIHTQILPRYFHFRVLTGSVVSLPTVENLRKLWVGYLSLFGFQEGRALFSVSGMLALGGVFAAAVLLVVSLRDVVPRNRSLNSPGAFMGAFYPVAMLCMTVAFLVLLGNDNYPQYYLPAFVWIFPYLGLLADRMPRPFKQATVKQAAVALACLCLFLNGAYNNLFYLDPADNQVDYDPGINVHTLERLQGAIDFIDENELEVGYAYFWDANIITEATDGRVTMIPINYDNTLNVLSYHEVLTSLTYREKEFVEDKAVFLLATIAHSGYFAATELAQYSVLAYEDEFYRIYIFDFSTEVWEHLNR